MTKIHEKSPCCRVKIIRYGKKRRQCTACKKTWTAWSKKRGRKARRSAGNPVQRYLKSSPSRESPSQEHTSKRATELARLRKDRDIFNQKGPWHLVPSGPLILVADAIVRYRQGVWHTWYFMLVRAVDGEDAVILPPYHREGKETPEGWSDAIGTIPTEVLKRVKALVSDGHRGLIGFATQHAWLIQRCHVHLIRAIQARRSRGKMGRRREEAEEIYLLVRRILRTPSLKEFIDARSRLEEIGWLTSSKMLKKVLLGFVSSAEDYRTYLKYPELNLPTTSNTAESLNALIGNLTFRARGFRGVASFNAWIVALCKERGTMKCRGEIPTELIC